MVTDRQVLIGIVIILVIILIISVPIVCVLFLIAVPMTPALTPKPGAQPVLLPTQKPAPEIVYVYIAPQQTWQSTSQPTPIPSQIINGGFEAGDLTGWTGSSKYFKIMHNSTERPGIAWAHSGYYTLYVDSTGTSCTIMQQVNIPANSAINFWLCMSYATSRDTANIEITVDGQRVQLLPFTYYFDDGAYWRNIKTPLGYNGVHTIAWTFNDVEARMDDISIVPM